MGRENTAAVARRMATQWWGEVQKQRKLGDGIWWFSTSGHGGIVVDIDVRDKLKSFSSRVYYGRNQQWMIPSEQHFAAFEEDCEAAIVEWAYPDIMQKVYKLFRTDLPYEDWEKQRVETLRSSLMRWNPCYYAEHPKPGA